MMQVLVVDDSALVRRQVAATLIGQGFAVVEAFDGQDAREKLEKFPDLKLVVCDVTMPRMSGLEFLHAIRYEGKHLDLPVIMLTTEGRPEMIAQAKQLGAKGWLIKPLKPELLLATVAKISGAMKAA